MDTEQKTMVLQNKPKKKELNNSYWNTNQQNPIINISDLSSGFAIDTLISGGAFGIIKGASKLGSANDGLVNSSTIDSSVFNNSQNIKFTKQDYLNKANELGYSNKIPPQKAPFNSHGQIVYFNGKNYITPDVDSHNVTNGWKMFDKKGNRIGSYSSDLEKIKD